MKKTINGVLKGAAFAAACVAAQAGLVTEYSSVFINSGGGALVQPPFAATLTYEQVGGDVSTTLTLNSALPTSEYVKDWWINAPAGAAVLSTSKVGAFDSPGVGAGSSGIGNGYSFDWTFSFATSGSTSKRFNEGETPAESITVVWHKASGSLTVADFLSETSSGDSGPLTSAFHLNGIPIPGTTGTTYSEKMGFAVPEPQEYALMAGLGMLGFAAYRRWKVS